MAPRHLIGFKGRYMIAVCCSGLPLHARALAWALASYISDDRRTCWPSAHTLARDTAMSRRHVFRMVEVLQVGGWLVKESGSFVKPNTYRLTLPPGVEPMIEARLNGSRPGDSRSPGVETPAAPGGDGGSAVWGLPGTQALQKPYMSPGLAPYELDAEDEDHIAAMRGRNAQRAWPQRG